MWPNNRPEPRPPILRIITPVSFSPGFFVFGPFCPLRPVEGTKETQRIEGHAQTVSVNRCDCIERTNRAANRRPVKLERLIGAFRPAVMTALLAASTGLLGSIEAIPFEKAPKSVDISVGHSHGTRRCLARIRLDVGFERPAPRQTTGSDARPATSTILQFEEQQDSMPTTTTTRRRLSPSRVQNPLETYLREINETALLTANEEKELSRAITAGSNEARDRMVRANLRLVVNIARAYNNKGLPLQDLIEEGNLGLLRAVEGFDPDMGTRFSTYASYWIKQSIKRALVNTGRTIRVPAYMVELLSKWRRATAQLTDELDRPPTLEEVAAKLEIPNKKLRIVKKAIQLYNSTPQTDTGDGWSLGEMVADQRQKGPEAEMVETDNLTHVYKMLETMEPREATILRMRFGLDDSEPKTLKEIGESLGLTRERVRQIENEALNRLAKGLTGD